MSYIMLCFTPVSQIMYNMSCITCHVSCHIMSHMSCFNMSYILCHVSYVMSHHVSCHLSHVMFQHVLHIMSCLTYHHVSHVRSCLICHVSPCLMSWINDRFMLIEPTGSKESSFLDCRFPVIMYLGLAIISIIRYPATRISTMSGLISIPPFWASWPQIDMLFGFHFCHGWFPSWQIM